MIYICSDIHGLYDRYEKLLQTIDLQESDTLYILGDMIDRGPDGIRILMDMIDRPNVIGFLGNHEHMMLMYLFGYDTVSWLLPFNGGKETLKAFEKLSIDDKRKILEYLDKISVIRYLNIAGHRYCLTHVGIYDKQEDLYCNFTAKGTNVKMLQDLVWGEKQYALGMIGACPEELCPTTYLTGHIMTRRYADDPMEADDEIVTAQFSNGCRYVDLDCGCALGEGMGKLACVTIDETTGELDLENALYID